MDLVKLNNSRTSFTMALDKLRRARESAALKVVSRA
jgi:hypothetical protein